MQKSREEKPEEELEIEKEAAKVRMQEARKKKSE